VGRHIAPLWHIILISNQPVFALTPYCYVLSRESTNTNFIVFVLKWNSLNQPSAAFKIITITITRTMWSLKWLTITPWRHLLESMGKLVILPMYSQPYNVIYHVFTIIKGLHWKLDSQLNLAHISKMFANLTCIIWIPVYSKQKLTLWSLV
jgi:hypothetical protein